MLDVKHEISEARSAIRAMQYAMECVIANQENDLNFSMNARKDNGDTAEEEFEAELIEIRDHLSDEAWLFAKYSFDYIDRKILDISEAIDSYQRNKK